MAYEFHISRVNSEISLEEWITAVDQIELARIDSDPLVILNPRTNQTIEIAGSPGDVAVLIDAGFGDGPTWTKCIRFSRVRGSFAPNEAVVYQDDHPLHLVAGQLASRLGAQITGDDGEVYEW